MLVGWAPIRWTGSAPQMDLRELPLRKEVLDGNVVTDVVIPGPGIDGRLWLPANVLCVSKSKMALGGVPRLGILEVRVNRCIDCSWRSDRPDPIMELGDEILDRDVGLFPR